MTGKIDMKALGSMLGVNLEGYKSTYVKDGVVFNRGNKGASKKNPTIELKRDGTIKSSHYVKLRGDALRSKCSPERRGSKSSRSYRLITKTRKMTARRASIIFKALNWSTRKSNRYLKGFTWLVPRVNRCLRPKVGGTEQQKRLRSAFCRGVITSLGKL